MKFNFSIRILLATFFGLTIGLSFIAYRVKRQRHAISVINDCNGAAFHKKIKLNQSFDDNLRYSVTSIEIPRVETSAEFEDAVNSLPSLKRIEITYDCEEAMASMRFLFPDVEILQSEYIKRIVEQFPDPRAVKSTDTRLSK